ncbi:glycosyltransferase [Petroclostridium xylanilyticum]|jgi:hypothetical protein|uniref:glycosyltransferase n=1 Tax=Petroclostridium xylanilyticum TaxID=1792311 RepID=UPI000B99CC96|nr:glycosyltransferase [Petroclostridium xylanilyticum]
MTAIKKIQFNCDHIFRLTDDTGIFQHAKYGVPDPTKGYTTDDNARALIAAAALYGRFRDKKYLELTYRYLSFILNAQNPKGKFKNFMNYNREFIEEEGSEDCFGRCLWALGYALSRNSVPQDIKKTCRYIIGKALPNVNHLNFPRAKAYSILGMGYMASQPHRKFCVKCCGSVFHKYSFFCSDNSRIQDIYSCINKLSEELVERYEQFCTDDWHWFEDIITYSNAVLPWSLLVAYKILKSKKYLEIALESLNFLEKITFANGYFKPVGCKGWMSRGKEPAAFDEQPLEACETTLMYLQAYEILKEKKYLEKARECFEWYHGKNSKNIKLIDRQSGGCYDGITDNGVNLNQGAESIISYCIAHMALLDYIPFIKRKVLRKGQHEEELK